MHIKISKTLQALVTGLEGICMCFQHINLGLWLLWMTLLHAIKVQAGVIKNFALTFSLVHISFSKNLDYPAYAEF